MQVLDIIFFWACRKRMEFATHDHMSNDHTDVLFEQINDDDGAG